MAKNLTTKSTKMDILFTCIGRRVSLLNSFKKAAKQLGINATFIGTDTAELCSALQLCDKKYLVKHAGHSEYLRELLKIVKNNKVKLLVPTIDLDLKLLAKNKKKFAQLGCCVLVSEPEVVEICQDKRKTFRFLTKKLSLLPPKLDLAVRGSGLYVQSVKKELEICIKIKEK